MLPESPEHRRHIRRWLRPDRLLRFGEFDALGLPVGLGYVAWAESGLNPRAVGLAGAAGLWQFTIELARENGLQVGDRKDDRMDPVKATRAAARVFASLLAEFGDDAALIAMTTVSTGPGPMRAMLRELALEKGGWRRGGRGYWRIYRLRKMNSEQMDYVSRIVAIAMFDRQMERYQVLTRER